MQRNQDTWQDCGRAPSTAEYQTAEDNLSHVQEGWSPNKGRKQLLEIVSFISKTLEENKNKSQLTVIFVTRNVASSLVLICPAMSPLTQCCLLFAEEGSRGGSNLGRLQASPAWGSQPALGVTPSSCAPPAPLLPPLSSGTEETQEESITKGLLLAKYTTKALQFIHS